MIYLVVVMATMLGFVARSGEDTQGRIGLPDMASNDLTVKIINTIGDPVAERRVTIRVDGSGPHASDDGLTVPIDEVGDDTDVNGEVVFNVRASEDYSPAADYIVTVPLERPTDDGQNQSEQKFTMPNSATTLHAILTA